MKSWYDYYILEGECPECGEEQEFCFCTPTEDGGYEDEGYMDLVDLMNRSDRVYSRRTTETRNEQFELFEVKPQAPKPKAKPKAKPKTKVKWTKSSRLDSWVSSRVLYFAFGSNMEQGQMIKRCPSAKLVDGQYALDGYKLTFCGHSNKWGGGVATIVKSGEGVVLGRLYSLTWSDIRRLDGFEGHPYVYKRQYITLTDGQSVLTYIKPVKKNLNPPSTLYFRTIARGYQQVGYELDKLVDASII